MELSSFDPVNSLKSHGLSTTTIARIAHVTVSVLKTLAWDSAPANDLTFTRLSNAVSLLDSLKKIKTLPVEAATFYEEQIVTMEKNGETCYCPAHHLYESGIWTQENFIPYAESSTFYSRNDFSIDFPLITKAVNAPGGYKVIVCKYPVTRLDLEESSALAGFIVIK